MLHINRSKKRVDLRLFKGKSDEKQSISLRVCPTALPNILKNSHDDLFV